MPVPMSNNVKKHAELAVWVNEERLSQGVAGVVFADRDGTLIEHEHYLSDPDRVFLVPGVADAIKRLLDQNYAFFLHTNQSGVGRGYFSMDDVFACHSRMLEQIGITEDELGGWCIAPESPASDVLYRKPSPRFIDEVAEHNEAGKFNCHMIGDSLSDLQTAWNAGIQAWAVTSGVNSIDYFEDLVSHSADFSIQLDFAKCVDLILQSA